MADDNLFNEGGQGGQEGEGGQDQAAMTAQLQSAFQDALKSQPSDPALTGALEGIQQQLANMQQAQQQAAQQPVGPAVPAQQGDVLDEFAQDPKGFVNQAATEQVERLVQERMGPALKIQFEQSRDALVDSQRSALEGELGQGAWDELFAADFEATLGELPLAVQASKQHVDAAVSAIYGRLMRDPEMRQKLVERQGQAEKDREAAQLAAQGPPAMLGRGRVPPQGDTLSTEEQDFIQELQRAGIQYNGDQYLAARKLGGSERAWRDHLAEKRKAG